LRRFAGICQAASRVFIFDYGGTLLHKEKYDIYIKRQTLSAIAGRKPSGERRVSLSPFFPAKCAHVLSLSVSPAEDMMSAIEKLSNDPLNVVVSDWSPSFSKT
jgi:hypothetical protein